MPRVARVVVPGVPHHITQRGNNRQDVFFVDDDRVFYLRMLKKYAGMNGLSILAYCLMSDHVHLVGVPHNESALAEAVGRTSFVYAQYVNDLHGRSGHLWQSRFYSCPLDEAHCWNALRYVERNPVRARIATRAWEYPWSSATVHCGGDDKLQLVDKRLWNALAGARDWQEALSAAQSDVDVNDLRRATMTGRPLGSDSFLSRLEVSLNRRLRPLPIGRPRKSEKRKK